MKGYWNGGQVYKIKHMPGPMDGNRDQARRSIQALLRVQGRVDRSQRKEIHHHGTFHN